MHKVNKSKFEIYLDAIVQMQRDIIDYLCPHPRIWVSDAKGNDTCEIKYSRSKSEWVYEFSVKEDYGTQIYKHPLPFKKLPIGLDERMLYKWSLDYAKYIHRHHKTWE